MGKTSTTQVWVPCDKILLKYYAKMCAHKHTKAYAPRLEGRSML